MAPNRNTLLNAADVIPRRMIHVCLPLSIPHDALSSNVGAAPVTLDRFSSVSAAQTLYHRRLSFISHVRVGSVDCALWIEFFDFSNSCWGQIFGVLNTRV